MASQSIQTRLSWCMQHGNLTVADLARWFDRPDPTVRGWIRNGGRVGGPPQDTKAIYDALAALEKAIKDRRGFPVPQMTPSDRITYLGKLLY